MRPLQSLTRAFRPPAAAAPRRAPFSPRGNPPRRHPKTSRPYSTNPPPPPPPPPAAKANTKASITRADRILARLPRPLQRYTSRLRGAPLTHVVAFLVLHELTAVVPLVGLFGLFHFTDHVPVAYMLAHYGGYVREGVGRFERWFRRRGWFGFGEGGVEEGQGVQQQQSKDGGVMERWERDPKYRVVVEIGLAYALTKVLLPLRIIGSVWATPWFAGVLGRLGRVFGRRGG